MTYHIAKINQLNAVYVHLSSDIYDLCKALELDENITVEDLDNEIANVLNYPVITEDDKDLKARKTSYLTELQTLLKLKNKLIDVYEQLNLFFNLAMADYAIDLNSTHHTKTPRQDTPDSTSSTTSLNTLSPSSHSTELSFDMAFGEDSTASSEAEPLEDGDNKAIIYPKDLTEKLIQYNTIAEWIKSIVHIDYTIKVNIDIEIKNAMETIRETIEEDRGQTATEALTLFTPVIAEKPVMPRNDTGKATINNNVTPPTIDHAQRTFTPENQSAVARNLDFVELRYRVIRTPLVRNRAVTSSDTSMTTNPELSLVTQNLNNLLKIICEEKSRLEKEVLLRDPQNTFFISRNITNAKITAIDTLLTQINGDRALKTDQDIFNNLLLTINSRGKQGPYQDFWNAIKLQRDIRTFFGNTDCTKTLIKFADNLANNEHTPSPK